MTKDEFFEIYKSKLESAINQHENDFETKQSYIYLIDNELPNLDKQAKSFVLKQLVTRHVEHVALVDLIQELVVDE
ncbi:hypothetical protein QVA72_01535 [Staphylococcus simulans]|uniref:Phage protein n=1 Tax=Staphylococcus simulans UMC-CNS-990 TaxID=1405498 RepID=A0ABN0PDD7_STASI|nr:hypothetical protein [Staphylococcus simulans]ERS93559.1 hypothetical protein SSIM_05000 [Staphylococcus simulans UMC-CNS-990]MCE5023458.1 hypothetical protein [Staphylococcus simulans]MCE5148607.1 hypothetical protein [Staphylococcus simulans]MDQ7113559.1 hypothetical protein [Staphylococcus simulans]MDQ7114532.1 hypothetical protein [Staphylococcus simulans]